MNYFAGKSVKDRLQQYERIRQGIALLKTPEQSPSADPAIHPPATSTDSSLSCDLPVSPGLLVPEGSVSMDAVLPVSPPGGICPNPPDIGRVPETTESEWNLSPADSGPVQTYYRVGIAQGSVRWFNTNKHVIDTILELPELSTRQL